MIPSTSAAATGSATGTHGIPAPAGVSDAGDAVEAANRADVGDVGDVGDAARRAARNRSTESASSPPTRARTKPTNGAPPSATRRPTGESGWLNASCSHGNPP